MTLKDKLKDYHKLIMTLEIAGLLHDTGKLDSRFIDYRRKWQEGKDGWNYYNDPHDDEEKPFFDHDPLLHEFETLRNTLSKNISVFCGREEIWINGHRLGLNISLKELVHQHTRAVHDLSKFLKFGDSIDSAYDRNNPLMVMEQKNQELFMSTVFGYESPLKVALFDNSRKLLYCQLNTLLLDYLSNLEPDKRRKIFNRFEDAFKIGITDTCRPANDIPLWQHVYMTTALCKIFFLHFLIYGELFKRYEDCRFSLLGFGWNGLGFISKGHKIGDVVARKEIIKILKKKIKEIVEYSYPIGMNVYDDDNGIYFIIPAILEDKKGVDEYKGLLQEIRERV
ncbi:MAG: hypothetical protein KKA99_06515, partial [Gammaproteobacteria bacterium]|nr:hypothetical protein [Gammaproteobacteria bacterium]